MNHLPVQTWRAASLLLILLLLALPAWSQLPTPPDADYPYRRDIEKLRFDKAQEKILRHLARDTNNLPCHYAAFMLYSADAAPCRNYDKAYHHLARVRQLYLNADADLLQRYDRDNFSGARIDFDLRHLALLARAHAHNVNTLDAYNHLLTLYTLAPQDIRQTITDSRDSLEFLHAQHIRSFSTLQDFISRRPNSTYLPPAIILRDSLAFAHADSIHSASAYHDFCLSYPSSHLLSRATDSLYLVDYRDVRRLNREQYYRAYALRHPRSPYATRSIWLADSIEFLQKTSPDNWESYILYLDNHNANNSWTAQAIDSLASIALSCGSIRALQQAALRIPPNHPLLYAIGSKLHHAYLHKSIRNYHRFYSHFPNLVPDSIHSADSLAYLTFLASDTIPVDSCIRAIAPAHEAYIMLQQRIENRLSLSLDPLEEINLYADVFQNDYDFLRLQATLSANNPKPHLQPVSSLNHTSADEHHPVLSLGGDILYFAAHGRPDNLGGDDIFISHFNGKGWGTPVVDTTLSHQTSNEIPLSASVDGRTLLLSLGGSLFIADASPLGWQLRPFPNLLPDATIINDAALCADGISVIFVARTISDRELDSSLNLYITQRLTPDTWSDPVELGPSINTPFDERSPFLLPDMHTLYFASESHGAIGQSDIFVSTRLNDSSWTSWSQPLNIGSNINTPGPDLALQVSPSGSTAYISRQSQSSLDLYTLHLPSSHSHNVAKVSGRVLDRDGHPLSTSIRWEDPLSAQLIGQCSTNPADGSYLILLPLNHHYSLYLSDSSLCPDAAYLDLREHNAPTNHTINFVASTLEQAIAHGQPIILKNTAYATSDHLFLPSSQSELIHLAHLIRTHNLSVEIGSHTDGNATDLESQTLSQRRADAIRNYLISLGCSPDRITAVGYGSSRPFSSSKPGSLRTSNRRTEVRILPSY